MATARDQVRALSCVTATESGVAEAWRAAAGSDWAFQTSSSESDCGMRRMHAGKLGETIDDSSGADHVWPASPERLKYCTPPFDRHQVSSEPPGNSTTPGSLSSKSPPVVEAATRVARHVLALSRVRPAESRAIHRMQRWILKCTGRRQVRSSLSR